VSDWNNNYPFSFRQYLPNKPDKFEIKLYQLSNSKSGYICDFEVCTGKDFDPNPDGDEEDKQLGHSYNVVLGLLRIVVSSWDSLLIISNVEKLVNLNTCPWT
jgi:hypothetical protein